MVERRCGGKKKEVKKAKKKAEWVVKNEFTEDVGRRMFYMVFSEKPKQYSGLQEIKPPSGKLVWVFSPNNFYPQSSPGPSLYFLKIVDQPSHKMLSFRLDIASPLHLV